MSEYMYQCRLTREDTTTVAYIDQKAARVGARVELKGEEGLWTVVSIGDCKEAEWVRANENRFKEFQGSLKGGGIR